MKIKNLLKNSLNSIAHHEIPDTTDLWPQIAAQMERKEPTAMNSKLKLAWTTLLVLLGLALATTGVYALVHYFQDPGLNAANDAGLITELNVTAVPTLLPTPTRAPLPAAIGETRTMEGVSLTLDWVYLDSNWQSVGFTVRGLSGEMKIGLPVLQVGDYIPLEYGSASLSLLPQTDGSLSGRYVIYQSAHDPAQPSSADHAPIHLDIPLLDVNRQTTATYTFAAADVLINHGRVTGMNTSDVRTSGVAMNLISAILDTDETRIHICYTEPEGKSLKIQSTDLQWGKTVMETMNMNGTPSQQVMDAGVINGEHCADILFAAAPPDALAFRLGVPELQDQNGDTIRGDWYFFWGELAHNAPVPGYTRQEIPLDSQTTGDVKITLLKAYADASRLAVVLRIQGKEPGTFPLMQLFDPDGLPFNSGYMFESDENDPTLYTAIFNLEDMSGMADAPFSKINPLGGERFSGTLNVVFNSTNTAEAAQSFNFTLDLPIYPAVIYTPRQVMSANGVDMRLDEVKITPSYTEAIVCYTKPDANDWYLGWPGSTVQIGADQGSVDNTHILFDSDYPELAAPPAGWVSPIQTGRCISVGFPVGHHQQPETLTLSVNALEQTAADLTAIPEDQLQAAYQKLREQGIEMNWVASSGNGGGGYYPQITQKPENMTEETVLALFYEALGYNHPGPWTFTLQINP